MLAPCFCVTVPGPIVRKLPGVRAHRSGKKRCRRPTMESSHSGSIIGISRLVNTTRKGEDPIGPSGTKKLRRRRGRAWTARVPGGDNGQYQLVGLFLKFEDHLDPANFVLFAKVHGRSRRNKVHGFGLLARPGVEIFEVEAGILLLKKYAHALHRSGSLHLAWNRKSACHAKLRWIRRPDSMPDRT